MHEQSISAPTQDRPILWLLGGYMWLYIHRPFEVWPWLGAMHFERVYMLVTILMWAIVGNKVWVKNRLTPAFVLFAMVVLVSWLGSAYAADGQETVENFFKILVFYVLVMSTVHNERDLKLLVVLFLVAMGLYMTHALWELHNGRHVYVMGTARMVGVDTSNGDPNSFAGTIVYSLPMVYPVWYEVRKVWHRLALLGYVLLSATCVLLTGSRMGFVGLSTLVIGGMILSRHRLKLLVLLCVTTPIVWAALPEDRQNRYLTLLDPSYGPKNAQASADSRMLFFWEGIRLWRENPVLGLGPVGFVKAAGLGHQTHNLYAQVLSELGTLGAIALAILVAAFGQNMLEMRQLSCGNLAAGIGFFNRLSIAVVVTLVLLLLLGMAAHNLFRYTWEWYGAFQAIAIHCCRQRVSGEYISTEEAG